MNKIWILTLQDIKNVSRDSLMILTFLYPWVLAVLLPFLLPYFTENLRNYVNLENYYDLIITSAALATSTLLGITQGLNLLDEKDTGTFQALRVTPLSIGAYFVQKLGLISIITFIATVLIIPIIGIMGEMDFVAIVFISLAATIMAPIAMLGLATFATNKVEGIAITKATGFLSLIPVVAYFVPNPYDLFLGVFPTYWAAKAFWVAFDGDGNYLWYCLIGIVYQLIWVLILYGWFRARVMR